MDKNSLYRTSTSSLNWSVDYFRADGTGQFLSYTSTGFGSSSSRGGGVIDFMY